MIDFSHIDPVARIDAKYILSKLSEEMIFFYYFGHFELGKVYPSKFRKDRKPSTGFYISKSGHIKYNDLRTGEKLNCFEFVAKLYGLSFKETCNLIAKDFGLIRGGNNSAVIEKIMAQSLAFDREAKKNTIIQIIPDVWQSHHIKYWNDYSISVDDLKREEIYPVKELFVNKMKYAVEPLCFAYVVYEKIGKETKTYLKIYQPHSKTMKWLSNIPLTVPFGMHNLKYGEDHIGIGKAQKDRLILLKLIPSVIGTQNESEAALPEPLVKHIKFHFPRRTIIWDSDETGVENCKKFNEKGFGYFNTPKQLLENGIKDVSDFVKAYGLDELERLLIEKEII